MIYHSYTFCDSPAFWQTSLQEPASITMEGILLFNKHLLFLLTVIVIFVAWLLVFTIIHFLEFNKPTKINVYDSILMCGYPMISESIILNSADSIRWSPVLQKGIEILSQDI